MLCKKPTPSFTFFLDSETLLNDDVGMAMDTVINEIEYEAAFKEGDVTKETLREVPLNHS